jgi:hypothetical protein
MWWSTQSDVSAYLPHESELFRRHNPPEATGRLKREVIQRVKLHNPVSLMEV